nr:MAG TPA: hypothetical protein [Caudoviricetes sp.]
MMDDLKSATLPRAYDFMTTTYEDTSEEKLLKIWKDRFSEYFSNIIPQVAEYRFRIYDPKDPPKSLIILTHDGRIMEFRMTKYGSAELKTLN